MNNTSNSTQLSKNPFLNGLAHTFRVTNIGLAIFLLVLCCIFAVILLILIILIVRSCLRRKIIPKRKKKPMKPIYLDDLAGGRVGQTNLGYLDYSLEYIVEKKTLKVGVVRASDLPSHSDMSDVVNPYVAIRLYSEGSGRPVLFGKVNKTSVRHNNANPTWQQDFAYSFPSGDTQLRETRIQYTVYDSDNLGQDKVIGQVDVLVRDLDMSDYVGQILEKKVPIQPALAEASGVGELCVGMAYHPSLGKIDVNIYEARQLQVSESQWRKQHVKVKVRVKHKHTSIGREETKERMELVNPYFNEKFTFKVRENQLDDAEVRCRVLSRRIGLRSRGELGEVVIGPNSSMPSGIKQWEDMLKEPNRAHVVWHVLTVEDS